jgi:ABC-type transport system involved in multi-copper enzyme maturation permease subunit
MIRAYRAEFTKLLRHKVLLVTLAVALLFAVGAAAIVVNAAKPAAQYGPGESRALSIDALADAGGGTQVFRGASSFAGVFVLVVFIAWTAIEFSRGTMRTMLLHQPRRLRLLAGKVLALLTFAAGVLALSEVASWITARIVAPGAGIDTSAWTTFAGLGAGLGDYGAVLLWVTGYALLGTALAVGFRSVPVALGVGIAWFGPFEHLLQNNWSTASRVFPGLGLEAFVAGGTPDVTAGRAFVVVLLYVAVASVLASTLFVRRDVTG